MPVHAQAGRQIPGLVKAPLTQPLLADRHPRHRVKFAAVCLGGRGGHHAAKAVQTAQPSLELIVENGLSHRVLVVKRRRAAPESGALPDRPAIGQRLLADVAQQLLADPPAAERAAPREEQVHQPIGGFVEFLIEVHVTPPPSISAAGRCTGAADGRWPPSVPGPYRRPPAPAAPVPG